MDGSALLRFKDALVGQMQGRVGNITYQSPTQAADVQGPDGSGRTMWFKDEASADIEVVVLTGTPVQWDETFTATVVVQVVGQTSDDTQEQVDTEATAMLGELIGSCATDPTFGVADDTDILFRYAIPKAWRYVSGYLVSERRACRFEVDIEVSSRLTLEVL